MSYPQLPLDIEIKKVSFLAQDYVCAEENADYWRWHYRLGNGDGVFHPWRSVGCGRNDGWPDARGRP